jgi:DNA helicase-2/ATP-dependent DNA helicase PcrA
MLNFLSQKQKEAVGIDSRIVTVKACPGSGKTFIVAAKIVEKLSRWKKDNVGMAVLSFTNTAWKEIEKNLIKYKKESIRYPHFLGTIDSFINHYIFLPFGHLVMDCERRPILVGEPHEKWHARNFVGEKYFDKSSFDINGDFIFTKKFPPPPSSKPKAMYSIKKTKNDLLKRGYANQHDANYFALKIVREYPEITKSLVGRFSILLVDEAQDTTEIQMAIIDELLKAGLKEVFMVGDPDQAIFEWNNANPELFMNKCKEGEMIKLEECRRSSQNICNFVHRLSTLENPAIAVSPEVSCLEVKPEIVEYDNLSDIKDLFLEKCASLDIKINKGNVSILCRNNKTVNALKNLYNDPLSVQTEYDPDVWREGFAWYRNICEGLFLIEKKDYKTGYKLVERGCFEKLTNKNYSREAIKMIIRINGIVKWRKFIHKIIVEAPSPSGDLSFWLSSFYSLFEKILKIEDNNAIKRDKKNLLVENVFSASTNDKGLSFPIELGTIHSVKGETFEATLVILDNNGGSAKYANMLKKHNANDLLVDELRTVYVGLTRPRKFLMLAVPKGDYDCWNNFLNK